MSSVNNQYSISAIIPMYNEEENARRVIDSVLDILGQVAKDWEMVIIESGSTDNTREIVEKAAAKNPRIVPVFQERREGIGSALRLGYSKVSKDLIWHVDSDLPFDLNEINRAMIYFDRFDVVIGYRTTKKGQRCAYGWTYSNKNISENIIRGAFHIGYNLLIKSCFGLEFKDINFSFKVFKSKFLKMMHLSSNGWFIDAELLLEIIRAGGKVKEIEIEYQQREFGKSTVRLMAPINILKEMMFYRFNRWNKETGKVK